MQKSLRPPQILIFGFLLIILIGTFLLKLPVASAQQPLTWLEALFTATSAVCVTGLVVVDTGTRFTIFGQAVILALIQLGGLGFMTFATLVAFVLGRRIYFRERLLLQEALNHSSVEGIVRMVQRIVVFTLLMEGFGAVVFTARLTPVVGWPDGIWYGLFHAVSAFNNAGFDLMGNFQSLTGFVADPVVNLMVALLVVIGGLGFAVITDMVFMRHWSRYNLHTRMVLVTTLVMLAGGWLFFWLTERSNPATLGSLDSATRAMAAAFQSVTARTAGFNTIDQGALLLPSQFFLLFLMFVGASPGSTGGGIKTTTFATLILTVRHIIRRQPDVVLFERRLPEMQIHKAVAIFFLSMSWVLLATLLLVFTEGADLLTTLFEVVSAFGTVGLSLGLTTELSVAGRVIIILTMFLGRLGPLTIFLALAAGEQKTSIRYPEERVLLG